MERKLATAGIIYFTLGILFALIYAMYYHWGAFSFFSPGFYIVVLSWPVQIPGFINDLFIYGLSGKELLQGF